MSVSACVVAVVVIALFMCAGSDECQRTEHRTPAVARQELRQVAVVDCCGCVGGLKAFVLRFTCALSSLKRGSGGFLRRFATCCRRYRSFNNKVEG